MTSTEQKVLSLFRKIYLKISPIRKPKSLPEQYSQAILGHDEGNNLISNLLQSDKPFMITRLGATELSCLVNALEINSFEQKSKYIQYYKYIIGQNIDWLPNTINKMNVWSGFYPSNPANLEKFCQIYFQDLAEASLIGVWYNHKEHEVINRFALQAALTELENLEPYYHPEPWSKYLEGKKVLVIHPFSDSIQTQFAKRHLLFPNQPVLPNFELRTLTAVQSIAGQRPPYPDWFAALEAMCQQMREVDFEVAIIGAGAYGLPLAAAAKRMGKQAIHLGGATQILFGIKGKRWDDMPEISRLYNEHWIRPLESERPTNANAVEDACYW